MKAKKVFMIFVAGGLAILLTAFGYKPAQTPAVTKSNHWGLWPNPANDVLMLSAPASFSNNDGDTYEITDLSGRQLQQGNINTAPLQININDLPAGMYVLNISAASSDSKTIKFVKE